MSSRDVYAADRLRRRCPICQAASGEWHEEGSACATGAQGPWQHNNKQETLRVMAILTQQHGGQPGG